MVSRTELGRRKVTLNPKALVELRTKQAMNQEDLAGRAKVSVRTIQRAESGSQIGLQTTQQIATALGVMPDAIRITEESHRIDNPTADEKDLARVTLLPARSARALLDVATACDECRLDHEVDIGPDAIQAAIELCDAFGPYLPVLCPEVTSFDGSSDNPARKLADRLRLESKLNASMEQLLERGIGVFVGSYVDFIQRPRYDIDEGCWSTRINQKYEDVKIGIVRLGPASSSQLIARVKTEPIPF